MSASTKLPRERVDSLLLLTPAEEVLFPDNKVVFSLEQDSVTARQLKNLEFAIFAPKTDLESGVVPPAGTVVKIQGFQSGKRVQKTKAESLFPVKIISVEERFSETGEKYFTANWERIMDSPISKGDWQDQGFQHELSEFKKNIQSILVLMGMTGYIHQVPYAEPYFNEGIMALESTDWQNFTKDLNKAAMIFNYSPLLHKQELLAVLAEPKALKRFSVLVEMAIKDYEHMQKLKSIITETMGATGDVSGLNGETRHPLEKLYNEKKDKIPENARREIEAELRNFVGKQQSSETAQLERWLNFVLSLPWGIYTGADVNISLLREMLEQDHYGLMNVKKRITRFLAAYKRKVNKHGLILGFFGPPGTGKTSIGASIAESLGRKFQIIALGGINDESEIRGHRRTYVGAIAGEITKAIERAGTMDPVIMLDEIDLVGPSGPQGDVSGALQELLDPKKNNKFRDHYLGFDFDLSRVLFIVTGNYPERMRPALRNRVEPVYFNGYTDREKREIACRHIIPKQLSENKLDADSLREEGILSLEIEEGALKVLLEKTKEAGVRNLERAIRTICESVAEKIGEGQALYGSSGNWTISAENIQNFIELPPNYETDDDIFSLPAGCAIGLVVGPLGGDIIIIEGSRRKNSKLELHLTGHKQELEARAVITKNSAWTALNRLVHEGGLFENTDFKWWIDLNITNGDEEPVVGPSAGSTMYVALTSLLLDVPVEPGLAMTGKIRKKRRNVGAVGGIQEKILGAYRKGITKFIIPEANRPDYEKIPEEDRVNFSVHFAATPEDYLRYAFPREERVKNYIEKISSLDIQKGTV